MRGIVKEVQPLKLVLTDGTELPYGLLVWSTGVGASAFVKSLPFPKSPGGRCAWLLKLCIWLPYIFYLVHSQSLTFLTLSRVGDILYLVVFLNVVKLMLSKEE